MGWLDELEYDFEYVCSSCDQRWSEHGKEASLHGTDCRCGNGVLEYKGFLPPDDFHLMTKISYERNGRMAYAVSDGKKTHYVSKMADTYYNSAVVNEGQGFSKDFREHVKDGISTDFQKFQKKLDAKATVTAATKSALTEA